MIDLKGISLLKCNEVEAIVQVGAAICERFELLISKFESSLTLRDRFAIQAPDMSKEYLTKKMQAEEILMRNDSNYKGRNATTIEAEYRYEWADAMIKEQQNRKNNMYYTIKEVNSGFKARIYDYNARGTRINIIWDSHRIFSDEEGAYDSIMEYAASHNISVELESSVTK